MSDSPFVNSPKHKQKMRDLAHKYNLGFLFNPGGGQYINPDKNFNCQITTCDDIMDYEKLKKAVENHKWT